MIKDGAVTINGRKRDETRIAHGAIVGRRMGATLAAVRRLIGKKRMTKT